MKKNDICVPQSISTLDLKLRDMHILTLIHMGQRDERERTPKKIAKESGLGLNTVKRSFELLWKKGLIDTEGHTDLHPVDEGFMLNLNGDVRDLPDLSLPERYLLSLIMEDWKHGYFHMTNEQITDRLKIKTDAIHAGLRKFRKQNLILVLKGHSEKKKTRMKARHLKANSTEISRQAGLARYAENQKKLALLNEQQTAVNQIIEVIAEESKENTFASTMVMENGTTQQDKIHRLWKSDPRDSHGYAKRAEEFAEAYKQFVYVGEVFGCECAVELTTGQLARFEELLSAIKFSRSTQHPINLQDVITVWFTGGFVLSPEVKVDQRIKYQEGDRSFELFTTDKVWRELYVYMRKIDSRDLEVRKKQFEERKRFLSEEQFLKDVLAA